jgi:hypothetical protein
MWYSGGVGAMNHGIGYAISSDGIHWTRDVNNPIFHKSDTGYPGYPWRQERTYCPMVIKEGSSYKMWFAGKDGETGDYSIGYTAAIPPVLEVDIDIKPGSDPNSINLKSKGVAPVAVLTTDDFDASDVDPVTVEFAGASPLRWAMEDVDGDGDEDLLFHFKTQELDLDVTSTEATLTGATFGGQPIQGTDTVNIVPKGK